MKRYVIVAIAPTYVHRMTRDYNDRRLAEVAARRLATNERGVIFRVEEVKA